MDKNLPQKQRDEILQVFSKQIWLRNLSSQVVKVGANKTESSSEEAISLSANKLNFDLSLTFDTLSAIMAHNKQGFL